MLATSLDLELPATGETVRDIESLARGAMGAETWTAYLQPCNDDELLAYLLGECVVLAAVYCPPDATRQVRGGDHRAGPGAAWLFQRLRWKARDWRDSQLRHWTLPALPDTDEDGSGVGGGGAGGAPDQVASDSGDAGLDAPGRLLEGGDRALLREVEALGLGPPPGARGRTEGAARALARLERRRVARVREAERGRDLDAVLAEAQAA